ncbi:MAG: GNAT family N-acetyltransferase [Desulfobacteraceae bacterium]|nr:GNAT family N-acetyltransferase [Desulfobacteraceae bacterium]
MLGIGYRSEMLFTKQNGVINEKPDYYVVRTPSNPDYYFGNYLLLKTPLSNGKKTQMERRFHEEIGSFPGIKHKTFCWTPHGDESEDVSGFVDAGYEYMECAVLTAGQKDIMSPAKRNGHIRIRGLEDENDWAQLTDCMLAERKEHYPLDSYSTFLTKRLNAYRKMIKEKTGIWYGAFLGDELAGTLGLFFDANFGCFQEVITKKRYRNQGICKTLVHSVCNKGFQRAEILVLIADENYHAAAIYESLGFKPTERMASLCWWPKESSNA